jgi:SAM-dependent methyltransferase
MPRIDSEKFYTSAINIHGTSAKGLNWASKENQELRFKIILELLPQDISNATLADAGCGFGDFYLYMKKNKRVPKRYIGIDSLSDMYSIASQNTAQEIIIADITKDEVPRAHYYVCSGALNVLEKFETHLFIRNCFNASTKGFIFNVLYGDKRSETYNYMTKKELQNIAKELNATQVIYREEYMSGDITVGFFK